MNGKPANSGDSKPTIWWLLVYSCGAVFLWLCFVVFLSTTISEDRLAREMRRWPSVRGTVIEAGYINFSRRYRTGGKLHAYVQIAYRYTVDERDYVGHRYTLNSRLNPRSVRKPYRYRELGREFAEGRQVTVYYNPSDPSQAVLRPRELYSDSDSPVFAAFVIACVWSGVTYWQFRKWRLDPGVSSR